MDDQFLLTRFVETRDASAFEELTRRHAGMVKAVCIRLLGNSHDAEEVAQECFLELARHADSVRSSVVGWLHRAATSRSLNLLRSRSRRRVRERAVGVDANTAGNGSDVSTRELERVITGAMTELPEDLRLPVKLHYFEGQSQRDVARALGVNQSTISRRMHEALLLLRERLMRAGFATTSPAVVLFLQYPLASAGEKNGMSNLPVTAVTIKSASAGGALFGWWNSIAAATIPILIYLVLGGWISLAVAVGLTFYVAVYRPNWLDELYSSVGLPGIYAQPTYSLSKWTWKRPPAGWRIQVLTSLASAVFFSAVAILFSARTTQPQTGTVVLGSVLAVWCVIHAFRIIYRARFVCTSEVDADPVLAVENQPPSAGLRSASLNLFDVVQLLVIGTAGIDFAIQSIVSDQQSLLWPAVFLVGAVGCGMAMMGVWLFYRLTKWNRLNFAIVAGAIASFVGKVVMRRQFQVASATAGFAGADDISILQNHTGVKFELSTTSDSTQRAEARTRRWTGTHSLLVACASVVLALSTVIVWNPTAVKGGALTLAAIQTSMLGWIVYRLAAFRRFDDPSVIRFAAIMVVAACFVLNSGVCLANWIG